MAFYEIHFTDLIEYQRHKFVCTLPLVPYASRDRSTYLLIIYNIVYTDTLPPLAQFSSTLQGLWRLQFNRYPANVENMVSS
jgi:hypothetical protein